MRHIDYFKETLYKTSKGFVSIAFADEKTWTEYIYRIKEFSTQMTLFENNKNLNIYSSVNTFYQPKRNFENLYNLNSLFCDIDCVVHDISIKRAYKELWRLWDSGVIPEPSLVINSGRGLHVYWHLDNCYASTKNNISFVPTYQALLNRFAQKLAYLGADFKASEPSRVLGVPDTFNIKSNTQRKIIKPMIDLVERDILHQEDIRYKIIELANVYLEKREYREKSVTHERRKLKFNELTLAFSRMEDYKSLIKIRNKARINEGYRNQLLYNYGLENIDYTKTKINLNESLTEINGLFRKPLDEREVIGVIKSLEKSKFKKIRNQTIIEQLEISTQEQQIMKTLIEREIKVSRYVEKKKQAIRNENGLTKRQQNKEDNIYLILDSYYIQKLTRKKIAENLRLSKKSVDKYLDSEIMQEDKILFLLGKKLKYREIEQILSVSRKTIVKVKKQHMETKK